jgi:hypothetical protein
MIITSTIIPRPPIQCVRLLQNNIEKGRFSTSVNIEDPVVVKPDDDSKKASTNEGIVPLKIYGRAPMSEKIIHDNVTEIKPSLLLSFSSFAFPDTPKKMKKSKIEIPEERIKGKKDSLYM